MRIAVSILASVLALLPATSRVQAEELFPPGTAACFVGAEVLPVVSGAAPYKPPAAGVSAIRLERSFPQLAYEEWREKQPPPKPEGRLVSVRTIVTFADAAKGAVKRFENGPWELLRCTDDVCDAGNYRVERQADGSVLLKITGGINVGGGEYRSGTSRPLPDGHVYRLSAKEMSACR
jgi:hypothetical protein